MFPHFGGGGGAALPEIGHSLRFNSADSAYAARTFGVPTNNLKWTWSGWVKRSALTSLQYIFNVGSSWAGSNQGNIKFLADDTLSFAQTATGSATTEFIRTTTQRFRDPSAWYHIVAVYDSANATAADRAILYVNGERITAFSSSTDPALNLASRINTDARSHELGRYGNGSGYLNGYLARVCFVDGSALTPSDFAYTDPNGQWRTKSAGACKAVVDAGGANSFMLDFNDGSSTTTLGNDYSAKGNNWTLTNFTRSAGVNDDWMEDTPTNNFAVLNPLDTGAGTRALSRANLEATDTASLGSWGSAASTIRVAAGKWYFESTFSGGVTTTPASNTSVVIGVSGTPALSAIIGTTTPSVSYRTDGRKIVNNVASAYGATYTTDVIGCAFDADARTVEFFKNGVSQGVISIDASANGYVLGVSLGWGYTAQPFANVNFGQRPFAYTPPTGFKALCTKNLPVGSVTTSGSFTGNAAADGPFVWLNGTPTAMTINGNAVTFGTHADKLANGFKLRTNSASYNASGSNTYSVSTNAGVFKYNNAEGNP